MNVYFTRHFTESAKQRLANSSTSLGEIASGLEDSVASRGIEDNPKIHRLSGVSGPIYVYRHKDWRIFLTKNDNDLIAMSITKYQD